VTDAPHTIVVLDPDVVWQSTLANAVAPHEVKAVPALIGALDLLPPVTPAGLFVGPNAAAEVLDEVMALRERRPGLLVVLVFEGVSVDLLRRAMHAGVYDVIDANAERELLARSLTEAVRELEGGHAQVVHAAESVKPATLIVVTAAKGGEGTTTVASNLAAALAEGGARTVALVDGDQRFGDVSLVMGMAPPAVGDGFEELGSSRQAVLDAVHEHRATSVMVLAPPRSTAPAEAVSESRMVEVISAVQAVAQFVVVDAPFGVVEAADLWGYADRVLLVSDLDPTSLKNSMIAARVIERSDARDNVELVVNRSRDGATEDEDVTAFVGLAVAARLPDADGVDASHEAGVPLVIREPESPYAVTMRVLAESLLALHQES
jgi:pilus assembly protein CpaE